MKKISIKTIQKLGIIPNNKQYYYANLETGKVIETTGLKSVVKKRVNVGGYEWYKCSNKKSRKELEIIIEELKRDNIDYAKQLKMFQQTANNVIKEKDKIISGVWELVKNN